MTKYQITVFVILFTQVCHAQKKFTTLIRFPESIDTKKVIIEYDDGATVHPVSATFFNNKATISGTFYSKYATLEIRYMKTEMSFNNNEYFLKEGYSSLVFSESRNGHTLAYPFDSCKLSNAIEIRKLPEAKKMRLFTEKEISELDEVEEYYFSKAEGKNKDSLIKIINSKSAIVIEKNMDFVKQNSDKYYSFWFFKRNFLSAECIQRYNGTLTKIFASFPAAFKNSFEGKDIVEKMYGAAYTKKGFKAPAFKAKDITGTTINLNNEKGKYVLLQFWASWCGPCLQEMPEIKKIRGSYSTDKLKVISVSIDSDSAAFVKAMTTHKMKWTNILDRQRDIYMRYGGKPIPMIYLIDKEGMIVYSSSEDRFEVLTELLSKSIQ